MKTVLLTIGILTNIVLTAQNKMIYRNDSVVSFEKIDSTFIINEYAIKNSDTIYIETVNYINVTNLFEHLFVYSFIRFDIDDSDYGDLYSMKMRGKLNDYLTYVEIKIYLTTGVYDRIEIWHGEQYTGVIEY